MIKAAFAYWDDRIAPVFDISRQIRVAEAESGRIVAEREELLAEDTPVHRVARLVELSVGTLVCGAISRPLSALIAAYGIRVIPFIAGDLSEVMKAWAGGCLESGGFAMPGCCDRRGRRGMNDIDQGEYFMNGRGRGGMGSGGGQGQGRVGHGRDRRGDPLARGAGGTCLCPKCGHREPHELGAPCVQKQCPKCGTALTRE